MNKLDFDFDSFEPMTEEQVGAIHEAQPMPNGSAGKGQGEIGASGGLDRIIVVTDSGYGVESVTGEVKLPLPGPGKVYVPIPVTVLQQAAQPTSTSNADDGRGEPHEQTQLTSNTVRFELVFNGTPARFGFLVCDLKQRIREESGELEWTIDRDPFTVYPVALPPDVQSVDVTFGDPNSDDTAVCGHVTARSLPGGKSLLIVSAERQPWPSLAQWWELIRAEAERLGFLAAQPMRAGSTPGRTEAQARLRQQLVDSLSEEELKTVSFDLGVDYESLPAQGKASKARELVAHCERSGKIPELVAQCRKLRPNVSWEQVP